MATNAHHDPEEFQPVAAILAFLLPGAGHAFLGHLHRGILIGAGVLGLFFGGILVGGIDVVDRRDDFIWFLGQSLVGPTAFGVDYAHQSFFKVTDPRSGQLRSAAPDEIRNPDGTPAKASEGQRPPNIKSLGRVNELGTLFCTIAGMLNLIAIIDAMFRPRRVAGVPA